MARTQKRMNFYKRMRAKTMKRVKPKSQSNFWSSKAPIYKTRTGVAMKKKLRGEW